MKKIMIIMLSVFVLFACSFDTNKLERIPVSGEVLTTGDDLEPYTEIIIAGPFDIILDQNGGSDIEIETYESLMQWVRTEMLEDGTMLLYLEDTSKSRSFNITFDDDEGFDELSRNAILSGSRLKWPGNEKLLNVVLSVDDLDKIQILGESKITTAQAFKTEKLKFEIAGAVHLDADFDLYAMSIELAGAGNLDMRGRAEYLSIECAGAGTIKAYELLTKNLNLEIAGVCNAQIYVEENLDVDLAGMGTVKYKGNPEHLSIDKAGIGSVKQVETNEKNETEI